MESRAKYSLVGLIVIFVVGFAVGTILWVSNAAEQRRYDFYTIYFRRFSLAGLQPNSAVTMRGIKIGTVESLNISAKDIELTKVIIRVQEDTPVKIDTEAVIDRNILTGISGIDLIKTSQDAQFLRSTPGEEYPVIPEGKTSLGALQENLPQILDKGAQTLTRLNSILSPENEALLSETIKNLHGFSAVLNQKQESIGRAVDNIAGMSDAAHETLKHFNEQSDALITSIRMASDSISIEASQAGQALTRAAETVSSTFEKYEDPKAIVNGPSSGALGPGERAR